MTSIVTRQQAVDLIMPSSGADVLDLGRQIISAGLAPKSMTRPEQVALAIRAGLESGLTPMRSLQAFVVINGQIAPKADTSIALIRKSGACKSLTMGMMHDTKGELSGYFIESERSDMPGVNRTEYTVAMAKKAGLWGKAGPWSQYPDRMLRARAIGYHGRDYYSDVLVFGHVAEELDEPIHQPKPVESVVVGVVDDLVKPLPSEAVVEPSQPAADPKPQPPAEPPPLTDEEKAEIQAAEAGTPEPTKAVTKSEIALAMKAKGVTGDSAKAVAEAYCDKVGASNVGLMDDAQRSAMLAWVQSDQFPNV